MARTKFSTLILFFIFVINVPIQSLHARSLLPPASYDGFLYKNRVGKSGAILIEAFYDPVCPYSRDSWPPLKQALHYYGSRTSLVVHLFPLPYHDNAFVASRALHIANLLNASFTFPLLEHFYNHQERFYNAQTHNKSRATIVKEIVKFATLAVGNSYYSEIKSGFNDRKTDMKTRVSFKYSTSRGVFGTPSFFVNGFALSDANSTIDYSYWRKIIDPLIKAKKGTRKDPSLLLL